MENQNNKKLCWVFLKENCHMNTRLNSDGTRKSLQFTDNGNKLDGPVDLAEVDIDELKKELSTGQNLSIKQWILDNVLAPAGKEILYIGVDRFYQWLVSDGILIAQDATRKASKNIKFYVSAFKAALRGEEIKATSIVQEAEKKTVILMDPTPCPDKEQPEPKVRTAEEISQVVSLLQKSILNIAACIKILTNTIIQSDESNPELISNAKQQLKELLSQEVMEQISLMLEEKNNFLLDEHSYQILSAFKRENLLVDGIEVPISRFLICNGDNHGESRQELS